MRVHTGVVCRFVFKCDAGSDVVCCVPQQHAYTTCGARRMTTDTGACKPCWVDARRLSTTQCSAHHRPTHKGNAQHTHEHATLRLQQLQRRGTTRVNGLHGGRCVVNGAGDAWWSHLQSCATNPGMRQQQQSYHTYTRMFPGGDTGTSCSAMLQKGHTWQWQPVTELSAATEDDAPGPATTCAWAVYRR